MVKPETAYRIDLSKSRAPGAFLGDQNLWRSDLERIYRLVDRQLQVVLRRDESNSRVRPEGRTEEDAPPHLAIAIFGPSGCGKSSLLRTLRHEVQESNQEVLGHYLKLAQQTHALPVMDPTTWGRADKFLYAFLASALVAAENGSSGDGERTYPKGLSPVQLAFQRVNEYLRIVDDPEPHGEADPLGLSLQRLERHISSLKLKEALGDFIDSLTQQLRVKMLVLPVDDLDMAPEHLADGLKIYQSFLTHPRLVPIFTFTDRLPEELIRADFRKVLALSEEGPARESPSQGTLDEKLAIQFLARCFPVRNRIRLGPAPARVQRATYEIGDPGYRPPVGDADSNERRILELLKISSFLLFGFPDREDPHQVKAALRPSTLRRQLQVADAMSECNMMVFSGPQFWEMVAGPKGPEAPIGEEFPEEWTDNRHRSRHRLRKHYRPEQPILLGEYEALATRLRAAGRATTWAAVFDRATWALLNVHRDALRELNLYLEDLYSWTPRELRSVVLDRILSRDRVLRRTVLDRWFNRTDYRRSQILSLLVANTFRPWMPGEEPDGDDETPLLAQLERELARDHTQASGRDDGTTEVDRETRIDRVRRHISLPATKGLLWFLNVTTGFYLPLIMARNWADAISPEEDVNERMGGNGWDLSNAPINAIRVADAKQEITSFGMLFLDPLGYRRALRAYTMEGNERTAWADQTSAENHLLLRIWSCHGYSRGRYWAAVSLWRGLGLIGGILELYHRQQGNIFDEKDAQLKRRRSEALRKKIEGLIRAHCLVGIIPGPPLEKHAEDTRMMHGFPKWQARQFDGDNEDSEGRGPICRLADAICKWLDSCRDEVVYPLPASKLWIGWSECFTRRIHGEYILGAFWPRLASAYAEKQTRDREWQRLAKQRSASDLKCALDIKERYDQAPQGRPGSDAGTSGKDDGNPEAGATYLWTGALAMGTWSDLLLEYWRGCPPILRLLLECPVLPKSPWLLEKEGHGPNRRIQAQTDLRAGDEYRTKLLALGLDSEGHSPAAKVPKEFSIRRALVEDFLTGKRRSWLEQEKPPALQVLKKDGAGDEYSRPMFTLPLRNAQELECGSEIAESPESTEVAEKADVQEEGQGSAPQAEQPDGGGDETSDDEHQQDDATERTSKSDNDPERP